MSTRSDYDVVIIPPELDEESIKERRRRRGLATYVPGWLAIGLAVSLAAHAGMVALFQKVQITSLQDAFNPEPEPPKYDPSQVDIEITLVEDTPEPPMQDIPLEKPEVVADLDEVKLDEAQQDTTDVALRNIRMTPEAPPVPEEVLQQIEQPVQVINRQDIDVVRRAAGDPGEDMMRDLEKEINRDLLVTEGPGNNPPSLDVTNLANSLQGDGGAGGTDTHTRGFGETVDALLRSTGLPKTLPDLVMPSDVLFATDSSDLRPEAVSSLQKLGNLLRKYPQVTFDIEGHTDSFGGDTYNMQLSLRRADSVKIWLVSNMQIAPERIVTRGLGKSQLIVPSGSEEQQQINRRVVIQVKTPPAP